MLLRRVISFLLLITGVFHLIVAFSPGAGDLKTGLTMFGGLYLALALWTFLGDRSAILSTMIATALGLGLGGVNYFHNGGPISLPIMFGIDVIILICGGLWLSKTKPGAAS